MGMRMCFIGPHYNMTFCPYFLTVSVIAIYVVWLMPTLEWYINLLTLVLFGTALVCLVGATCADPGIIPKGSGDIDTPPTDVAGAKWCVRCECWQPKGAQHCMDCDVCIDGYDHHCPMMGKCVGKGNLRYFTTFVSIAGMVPVYAIMIMLLKIGGSN